MSEENSEIRDPKHINQIFGILKKEYAIIENRPENNTDFNRLSFIKPHNKIKLKIFY